VGSGVHSGEPTLDHVRIQATAEHCLDFGNVPVSDRLEKLADALG
jgi:hypothetical protein